MKLNNIKDSFEDRKIEPSATAWDQLASRLDQEEKSNKKPVIYWLSAVAAVFILGMVLYPFLINEMDATKDTQEMIVIEESNHNTTSKEINNSNELVIEDNNELNKEVVNKTEARISNNGTISTASTTAEPTAIKNKSRTSTGIQNENKKSERIFINEAVAQQELPINNDNNNSSGIIASSIEDSTINPELLNAVAQNIIKRHTAEEEMELLLNEALGNTNTTSVAVKEMNVTQLLRETEWDIEAERRNKVNNAIFDQLGKLKSEAFALIGGKK